MEPGQRIAIIGSSGAGKTTLARLLAGLAVPDAGAVTFAGVALTDLDAAGLRNRVRLADEDAHLFATSIANNVRIGNPHADAGAIDAALRRTGLGPWLDALAEGVDTLVGEQGFAVSGGQRQRIAPARCLVSPVREQLAELRPTD